MALLSFVLVFCLIAALISGINSESNCKIMTLRHKGTKFFYVCNSKVKTIDQAAMICKNHNGRLPSLQREYRDGEFKDVFLGLNANLTIGSAGDWKSWLLDDNGLCLYWRAVWMSGKVWVSYQICDANPEKYNVICICTDCHEPVEVKSADGPTGSPSIHTGLIFGIVLSIYLVLGAVVASMWCWHRRRKQRRDTSPNGTSKQNTAHSGDNETIRPSSFASNTSNEAANKIESMQNTTYPGDKTIRPSSIASITSNGESNRFESTQNRANSNSYETNRPTSITSDEWGE